MKNKMDKKWNLVSTDLKQGKMFWKIWGTMYFVNKNRDKAAK